MRPPQFIHRLGIIQLDIQVLVYALERAADLDFVLEFDGDFVLDERLEEAIQTSASALIPLFFFGRLSVIGDGPEKEHLCCYQYGSAIEVNV